MNLTETQQRAFEYYNDNKNIFITGPGGCGKSFFIQSIYKDAKEKGKNICVTSLTGCSAILLNCNATTLHKWGSFGLGKGEERDILKKIIKTKRTKNYIETDILVIDEISMLNQKIFELLDYLCKKIRKNEEIAFGGIQIICSGDFYQLPPVCMDKTNILEKSFCFESELWEKTFDETFVFEKNFRQEQDSEFFSILQEIREGTVTFDTIETLVNCSKKEIDENDLIVPTKIFPIKKSVDMINNKELEKLTEKKYKYFPEVYNSNNVKITTINNKPLENEIDYIKKNSMFEESLELCVGCQVMCISNIDQERKLVNGLQGIIIDFVYNAEKNNYYPKIQFEYITNPVIIYEHTWNLESTDKYNIQQLPLILSWAITIHKSQGLSINKALIDIGNNIFEYGQTYVALSRVKTLEGLYLTRVNAKKIKANPKVINFYNNIKK